MFIVVSSLDSYGIIQAVRCGVEAALDKWRSYDYSVSIAIKASFARKEVMP